MVLDHTLVSLIWVMRGYSTRCNLPHLAAKQRPVATIRHGTMRSRAVSCNVLDTAVTPCSSAAQRRLPTHIRTKCAELRRQHHAVELLDSSTGGVCGWCSPRAGVSIQCCFECSLKSHVDPNLQHQPPRMSLEERINA